MADRPEPLQPLKLVSLLLQYPEEELWGDREQLRREAAERCGLRAVPRWGADQKLAWNRWAPLLCAIPGLAKWSAAEKRAAVAVVRSKGGRRESDFVHRFDRHRKLRAALLRLAEG